jgi:hypothetical protein
MNRSLWGARDAVGLRAWKTTPFATGYGMRGAGPLLQEAIPGQTLGGVQCAFWLVVYSYLQAAN